MDPVLLGLKPEDFAGHHILLLNRIPVDMQGFTTEKPSIVEDMDGNIWPVNMLIKILTKILKHHIMSWGRGSGLSHGCILFLELELCWIQLGLEMILDKNKWLSILGLSKSQFEF